MTAPFAIEASNPAARIDSLLLAAAGEFKPVDAPMVTMALDRLAREVERRPHATVEDRAAAIVDVVRCERFQVANRVGPDDALLDAVLERHEGHPILLAAILAEACRRAGWFAAPIRSGDDVLVAVRHRDRAIAVDPSGKCNVPRNPAWLCPHELAFLTLAQLSRLLALHGHMEQAIEASALRCALPIAEAARRRVDFETAALRAQLN